MALLEKKFGPKKKFFLRLTLNCIVILFFATMTWACRTVINGMENVTLMSLTSVPMNAMYWSTPIGCLLMIYYCCRSIFSDWLVWQSLDKKKD